MSANDFVRMASDPGFLGDPLVKTQHLLGQTWWEKISDDEVIGHHQLRAAHNRFTDLTFQRVDRRGHGQSSNEHFYKKVDGVWKFAGIRPNPRWNEYDFEQIFKGINIEDFLLLFNVRSSYYTTSAFLLNMAEDRILLENLNRSLSALPHKPATRPPSNPVSTASKRISTTSADIISSVSDSPSLHIVREVAFIALILSAQLLTTAGIGIGIAPLRVIGNHYGITNPGERSWYVAAFSLTAGTFILPAGRLGDMVGPKKIVVGAFAWYGLWSILCGVAYYSNSTFFNIARGLQGVGPAFLTPNALAIVGRTYGNGMKKNLIFAMFGACAPGGYVIAAAFSSLLALKTIWAWAFWIMGICLFVQAALAAVVIPAAANKGSLSEKGQGKPEQTFDWLGASTGVTGLVLFNVAWNQGPVVGWGDSYVPVLLGISILSFVGFVIVERRVEQPLLPVRALDAPVLFILSATAIGWASFGVWLYYVWEFLQELRHHSPLVASAQNAPSAITGFVSAVLTGLLITHLPVPYIMILALTAFTIVPILSATMPVDETYWASTFVSCLLIPFGMDMSFPVATIILSSSVPKDYQGMAASLVLTVCNYSISLGLGIAGTVVVEIDKMIPSTMSLSRPLQRICTRADQDVGRSEKLRDTSTE
ncbi:MAG: hypothetical protein Q9217_003931 [Psora testacea]